MRLPVRHPSELAAMREAGRVVASTLQAVREAAVPGVRLRDLDELAETHLREAGATSPFLGYAPAWAPTRQAVRLLEFGDRAAVDPDHPGKA